MSWDPETSCESPIEVAMLRALLAEAEGRGWGAGCVDHDQGVSHLHCRGEGSFCLGIEPQCRLDRLRIDFLLTLDFDNCCVCSSLVVECDGHDFHDRTKQQASRDRARDRRLALEGWQVFRFTGSDIHHEAERCAAECCDFLAGELELARAA